MFDSFLDFFIFGLFFLHNELNFLFFRKNLIYLVEGGGEFLEFVVPFGLHLDLLGNDVEKI